MLPEHFANYVRGVMSRVIERASDAFCLHEESDARGDSCWPISAEAHAWLIQVLESLEGLRTATEPDVLAVHLTKIALAFAPAEREGDVLGALAVAALQRCGRDFDAAVVRDRASDGSSPPKPEAIRRSGFGGPFFRAGLNMRSGGG